MSDRTPTPTADGIWSQQAHTARLHQLWQLSMRLQGEINPRIPITASDRMGYQTAAVDASDEPAWWAGEVRNEESKTRHDLVAHLNVYNREAGGRDWAHLGHTSSDITELATQLGIIENLHELRGHIASLLSQLCAQMVRWKDRVLVARTHGRPAQVTTYGWRIAHVVAAVMYWVDRFDYAIGIYPMRPMLGAVGTGADLQSVLVGWMPQGLCPRDTNGDGDCGGVACPHCGAHRDRPTPTELTERYINQMAAALAFHNVDPAPRQVYHRSIDLHIAALLVELASIAQTYATDRRLEAMNGLGWEAHDKTQIGSSAMPHKANPRFSERICSLGTLARADLTAAAEIAGMPWLEGDVSTSAARRELIPRMFRNIEAILSNWLHVTNIWQIDELVMATELRKHQQEVAISSIMLAMVQRGVTRTRAHELLREVADKAHGWGSAVDTMDEFRARLAHHPECPLGHAEIMTTIANITTPPGLVPDMIDSLAAGAQLLIGDMPIWQPPTPL